MNRPLPPVAGVIGWPIAHSKSPIIHRFWLEKLGLDGDYSRLPVAPDRLGDAIRALPALGFRGVNVTVPHKEAVIAHLDRLEPEAQAIGAINMVVVEQGVLVGGNTDAAGFAAPLASLPLDGAQVVVVGAGGAARAVLATLRARSVGHVTMLNRSLERAEALLRDLALNGTAAGLDAPLPPASLLVNASSLGMVGQPPLQLDLTPLASDAVVYDLVYAPLETELLGRARASGLATIDGLEMLVGQAAVAFERFFGVAPPREHDAELRARLTR